MLLNTLPRFRVVVIIVTTGIALLCSLGPLGIALAGSVVAAIGLSLFPIQSVLTLLAVKPVIDCFWNYELGQLGGSGVNLQSVVGALLPVAAVVGVQRLNAWPTDEKVWWLACLYVSVLGVGVLLSPAKVGAVADFMRFAFPVVFLAVGLYAGRGAARLSAIAAILALYGLVPATVSFLEAVGLIHPHARDTIVRVRGLYQHPIDVSMRAGLAFPFALALARMTQDRFSRWACASWAGMLSLLAVGTLVRSAIVATIMQWLAWGLSGRRRILAVVSLGVGIALITLLLPVGTVLRQTLNPIYEGASYRFASGRLLVWSAQLYAFRDASIGEKLFGHGLHMTPAITLEYVPASVVNPSAADYEESRITAHNQVLRLLTENGVVGVAVFSLLIISVLRRLLQHVHQGSERGYFARATLAGVTGVVVYSVSSTPFDLPSVTWPLWFAVGVAIAKRPIAQSVDPRGGARECGESRE